MAIKEVLLVKITGGGGGGDAPPGSAVIQDSQGVLAVQTSLTETLDLATDTGLLTVTISNDETILAQVETNDFQTFIDGGNESILAQTLSDVLGITHPNFEVIPSPTMDEALILVMNQDMEANSTPTETHVQEIQQAATETNPTPDSMESWLTVNQANDEFIPAQSMDEALILVMNTDPETNPAQTETHTQEISVTANDETNPTPNLMESWLDITQTVDEANATPDETAALAANFGAVDEANPTPSETQSAVAMFEPTNETVGGETTAHTTEYIVYLTSVANTGWSTATTTTLGGPPDLTYAFVQSNAGLNPPTVNGNIVLTFASIGTLALETRPSTISMNVRASRQNAAMTTAIVELSTNSGTSYTTIHNLSTALTSPNVPQTLTSTVNIDPANLGDIRVRVTASIKGTLVATAGLYIDTVWFSFSTTGE